MYDGLWHVTCRHWFCTSIISTTRAKTLVLFLDGVYFSIVFHLLCSKSSICVWVPSRYPFCVIPLVLLRVPWSDLVRLRDSIVRNYSLVSRPSGKVHVPLYTLLGSQRCFVWLISESLSGTQLRLVKCRRDLFASLHVRRLAACNQRLLYLLIAQCICKERVSD